MYIPLRVTTHATIGTSTLKAETVANWAKEAGIPAVGLCEDNTLAGSLAHSKILKKAGVQPVLGAAVSFDVNGKIAPLHLYARNEAGHALLLETLNTIALEKSMTLTAFVEKTGARTNDIVVLTGGRQGLLSVAGAQVLEMLAGFANVFVEIERTETRDANEHTLFNLAAQFKRPLVATSPMVCENEGMTLAHEAYLSIAAKTYLADADRPKLEKGAWLVDAETFKARFADIPQAVEATLNVARLCAMMLEPTAPVPPRFAFTNGVDEQTFLEQKAKAGLNERMAALIDAYGTVNARTYNDRLTHEITLIGKMGFSGYFLIVADFIGWAKDNGIPVGPGRGSGAGSLVAYALGITDIDPIKFGLMFERFLNPDRVSMPDFDIDFSQARRGDVIAYVRQRYGNENVAHIGTYAVLQSRAVVRSVGRVMGLPYPQVDRIAKMIPQNPTDPISLSDAMEEPGLKAELEKADESMRAVFETAQKLEGLNAHLSVHAAGIVIADRPIATIVPVHLDDNGMVTTSFDMKDVEASGLIKFDFLGLKNLDIIDEAIRFASMLGHDVSLDTLTFKDPDAYANLASGDGFGVFQVESTGMRRAMRMLNVDSIEDIIALISLYRPGPMDQIETYAQVKSGNKSAAYRHPVMENALSETYGVMVYQEQVMQIARDLAGYSLGEADVLRRAMGKKIQSEMEQQRTRFVDGAKDGWVEVTLENGETTVLHAQSKVVVNDGSGRKVTLQEAQDQELDVLI